MDAIYDRNILDVQTAKELLNKIILNNFSGLTTDEKTMWLSGMKGFLNYTDLNRIEGNCKTLSDIFSLNLITKINWTVGEFIKYSDFERILGNVLEIRNTKYIYSTTPTVPLAPINRYDKINDIEKILYDVYTIYSSNISDLDYMGDKFYLNEGMGVI